MEQRTEIVCRGVGYGALGGMATAELLLSIFLVPALFNVGVQGAGPMRSPHPREESSRCEYCLGHPSRPWIRPSERDQTQTPRRHSRNPA
jgi:hypothetical protein